MCRDRTVIDEDKWVMTVGSGVCVTGEGNETRETLGTRRRGGGEFWEGTDGTDILLRTLEIYRNRERGT